MKFPLVASALLTSAFFVACSGSDVGTEPVGVATKLLKATNAKDKLAIREALADEVVFGFLGIIESRGADDVAQQFFFPDSFPPIFTIETASADDDSATLTTQIEESSEGPARKYYELSLRGAEQLAAMRVSWDELVQSIASLPEGKAS